MSDITLNSESKYYVSTDNSKNLSDKVKNDHLRKHNSSKDLSREKSAEVRKSTENRYVLETKSVQKQLEREKRIERLCLELLKSTYKHDLEDLSLETKEEITSATKVR